MASIQKDLNLRVIWKDLYKIRHKWFIIGVQLGIARYVLKQFQESEKDPLSAVIDYWLSGNADPTIRVCWKSIAEAVEAVQETGLAAKIKNDYCRELLEKAPEPDTTAREATSGVMEKNTCEENLDELITKYDAYVSYVRLALQEKKISLEELWSFLQTLPTVTAQCKEKFVTEETDELLPKFGTVESIFTFLTMECSSFLNYEIFQDIAKFFKINIDSMNYPEHLQVYVKKHKVSTFVMINSLTKSKILNSCKKLAIEFDTEGFTSFEIIGKLVKRVARSLKLHSLTFHIADIKENCVEVMIPTFLGDKILKSDKVFTVQQKEELQAESVLSLEWNGHKFDFKKQSTSKLKKDILYAIFIVAVILSSICGWQCRKHFSAPEIFISENCSTNVTSNSLPLGFDGFCTNSQESVVMSCSRVANNQNFIDRTQCSSSLSAPELTLSELHEACETNAKSRHPECVAAMHRYCNRVTYPIIQDSVGISREHSNLKTHLSCVKAYWKGKVQISELQEFHKGCKVHKSQHRDCLSAIHRFCVDRLGSNFAGISQEVGDSDFIVGCFKVTHTERLRHQVLTDLHGLCEFPNSDSDNCFAAASRYCAQYFGSSGGITQEVNKEVMTVACYEASYSGIAHHIRNTDFFTAKTRGVEVCQLKFNVPQGEILACGQDTLFKKTYNNSNSSTEMISTLTFEKLVQDESRFEFSGPLVIEPSVSFSTSIPSVVSKEISLNSLRTVLFSTSQKVSNINVNCMEKCEVKVPPFTHIIKEAVVTRAKLKVPWTARIRNGLGAVVDVVGVWFGDDTYNLQIIQKVNSTSNPVE